MKQALHRRRDRLSRTREWRCRLSGPEMVRCEQRNRQERKTQYPEDPDPLKHNSPLAEEAHRARHRPVIGS